MSLTRWMICGRKIGKKVMLKNEYLISDLTQKVPDFDCSRAIWSSLNIIQIKADKFNYLFHKWKIKDSPNCDCGQIQTIRYIYRRMHTNKI